ncbi:hypothetical protein P4S95_16340 [Aneurinibacillus aneurinilyticus]|uniref:hypothetical protein n=1 Tax=Aneurinibacillus aneurinilyticus TaxID=1391 RepID=UPI002E1C7D27|nr:hypothetical protein [Aneurinibacillus aneurinilyticus]
MKKLLKVLGTASLVTMLLATPAFAGDLGVRNEVEPNNWITEAAGFDDIAVGKISDELDQDFWRVDIHKDGQLALVLPTSGTSNRLSFELLNENGVRLKQDVSDWNNPASITYQVKRGEKYFVKVSPIQLREPDAKYTIVKFYSFYN